jgi:tRNA(Leu) C34 or U34 (ribose-2'-O)-methylase TrmL
MRHIVLVAHNLRSCHNVGSLLRTAEGLGVKMVYLTGYTPYPAKPGDPRLPHEAAKVSKQINKTALGAENVVPWQRNADVFEVIAYLQKNGFRVAAVEQSPDSVALPDWEPANKVALLVGREVEGIEAAVLAACNQTLEIPMYGKKESFNVVQAAAMALYHCRFSKCYALAVIRSAANGPSVQDPLAALRSLKMTNNHNYYRMSLWLPNWAVRITSVPFPNQNKLPKTTTGITGRIFLFCCW